MHLTLHHFQASVKHMAARHTANAIRRWASHRESKVGMPYSQQEEQYMVNRSYFNSLP